MQTRSAALATVYDRQFFEQVADGSLRSARAVVPAVMEYVRPRTVVDVGCGTGAWLRAFAEAGVDSIQGLDGHYVQRDSLIIPIGSFTAHDLESPLETSERYDLAVCLEVVEHLGSGPARRLVGSLTRLAPVVLFSAAMPGQPGTHHINLQWPSYWEAEFRKHKYVRIDCLRDRLWHDDRVEWWYRQNLFIYADQDFLKQAPALMQAKARCSAEPFHFIHEITLRGYIAQELCLRRSIGRIRSRLRSAILGGLRALRGGLRS